MRGSGVWVWGGSNGGVAPVSRVLEVGVVLEGGVTENHRCLGTTAHREGVSNDRPLGTDKPLLVARDWHPTEWGPRARSRS